MEPTAYFFILTKDSDGEVQSSPPIEFTLCKDCWRRKTEFCKWRKDEEPGETSFCSEGERAEDVETSAN